LDEQPIEKDKRLRRQALISTVSNYIGQVIIFVTGFALTPFILSRLGRADYGLWLLAGSVIAYGSLFDFGIIGALTKYVAEYRARGDLKETSTIIATALVIYTVLGVLLAVLVYMAAPIFPRLFNVAEADRQMAVHLVRIMGIGLGLSIPSGTTYAVLRGLQRFGSINLITAGGTVMVALGTVVVLLLGGGLLEMVAVNIPLSLVMQIPAVLLIRRAEPELKLSWRGASRGWARRVFMYSSSTMAIQSAGQLRNKTDEIVIGAFLPVTAVTPYGLARRLSEAAQLLTHQFLVIILPLASQLEAEQDLDRLRQLFLAGTRLTLVIFLPVGLTMAVLADDLLALWVGAEYAEYAYLVWVLTAAGIFYVTQDSGSMILQGIGKHKWVAAAAILSGIANLGISIALVRPLGLLGVALGTLIPNILEGLFVLPYSARVLRVSYGALVRQVFIPALLPVAPVFLAMWGMGKLLDTRTVIGLVVTGGVGAAVYMLGYYLLSANPSEREGISEMAGEALTRLKGILR
jgi:O-antigen/teichoic acid export membrane protein